MNSLGHNENAIRLAALAGDAQIALDRVARGEADSVAGWLAYGAALNEGRALHKGDTEFGQWIISNALSQLGQADVHPKEREAAMWAAANADQLAEAQAASKARTVRGWHEQWKKIEAEREREAKEAERKARELAMKAEADSARAEAQVLAEKEKLAKDAAEKATSDESKARAEAEAKAAAHEKAKAEKAAEALEAALPEAIPQEDEVAAQFRKEFRKLTREAQEDDYVGFRLELAEAKKIISEQQRELDELKAWWTATTQGADNGRALSLARNEIHKVNGRLKEIQAQLARETRRANAMQKARDELQARLESQIIHMDGAA